MQFSQLRKEHQSPIPHEIIETTLKNTKSHSLFVKPHLYSFAAIAVLASLLWVNLPTKAWFADQKNVYNQWSERQLPDHSDIKISGNTQFNIHYNKQRRNIELIDGNILVDVAKDTQRPFYVTTDHVSIKALGTRFIVHHFGDATLLTMLHSTTYVETRLANGEKQTAYVHAGEQILINNAGLHSIQKILSHLAEGAWNKRMLAIDLMPLDQVLAILQSYENNSFHFNAKQLHSIQVSAILPLDGAGLNLLNDSLPIEIKENFIEQKVISAKK